MNAGIIKSLIAEESGKGKTILLTTHNMHDVEELCDRVGFIIGGEMNSVAVPEKLKAQYGSRKVVVEVADDIGAHCATEFDLEGLGNNQAFLDLLNSRELKTIHSMEASLDRVFADVTGVQLDSGEDLD